MGLGILTFIHSQLPLIIYILWILVVILTIFGKRLYGYYFLLFLLPFTYTLNKVHQYPFGNQVLDVLFFVITVSTFIHFKKKVEAASATPILLHCFIIIFSVCYGFLADPPLSFGSFGGHFFRLQIAKDYLTMPLLYWITLTIAQEENSEKRIFSTVCFILLIVMIVDWRFWNSAHWRSHAHFSYGVRDNSFGALGSNHLAAFVVEYTAIAISLFLYNRQKKVRFFLGAVILAAIYPIFFTYSRAGYMAIVAVIMWNFSFKKKFLIWTLILSLFMGGALISFVPQSVMERITMTKAENGQIDNSADTRLIIWHQGLKLFFENPMLGIGYQMVPAYIEVHGLRNMHNYILQMLVETGIIGFSIFLYLLYRAFMSGWWLFKKSIDGFHKGLGLGFCGCVLASVICNFFGDRWSFPQMQSYWWVFWALVDHAVISSCNTNSLI